MGLSQFRVKVVRAVSPVDMLLLIGVLGLAYALLGVANQFTGPFRPRTEIDLGLVPLLGYSFLSLVRVTAAYAISVVFTLTYGYAAAKSRRAEPILIALLDILQSVPVLGFMPGLVLALVALSPNSNLGLELAAVVMIFTGEGWNMVFSFYSSLKSVPTDLSDVSKVFRLNRWEVLRRVEIPHAMNGLLWNSMLSMAGGWFFLMVIESFTLGDRDFRLPGIGSYMAVAYERKDYTAIVMGIGAMFLLIFLVDRCVWAPLVAWSERFRLEGSPGRREESFVLTFFRRSKWTPIVLEFIETQLDNPPWKRFNLRRKATRGQTELVRSGALPVLYAVVAVGGGVTLYGAIQLFSLLSQATLTEWLSFFKGTALTFLRVMASVLLGSLWTIPLGVFIGTHPTWTRRLQPVVQIVASFPAPMLFPMFTYLFVRFGLGIEIGSAILMLFASQWYILFNVISGASVIPHQLLDLGKSFRLRGIALWQSIILPAIFPSLVNGWITAAGGAWNASIVSEFVPYGSKNLIATGIGASIFSAAQEGDFPALAAGVTTMVVTVVLLNRLLWNSLYRLAETRYRLEI